MRSMAAMPSAHGSSARSAGRLSMARSKSSATPSTLRIRSSPASPSSRSRSSAVRRRKFANSARSRWRSGHVLVRPRDRLVALGAQQVDLGGQGGGGHVDLVDALIGAGLAGHRSPVGAGGFGHDRTQAYRWSISSFIRPDTKRTVPIACGIGHPRRPEHADDADAATRAPVRREDERHVRHLLGRVLVADVDANGARPGDAGDQVGEVGAVLEGGEDAAELLALRELRGRHHVEQAVAEQLLDRRGVELLQRAARRALRRDAAGRIAGSAASSDASTRSASAAVRPSSSWLRNAATRDSSSCSVGSSSEIRTCLSDAFAQHEDEAGHAVADRDEVEAPQVGGRGLGGRRRARRRA